MIHPIKCTYLFLLLFVVSSCSNGFLEVTPRDQLSSETVFSDQSGADLFLNAIYGSLPDEEGKGYNYDAFENWSDNAVCSFHWSMSWTQSVARSYGAGSLNPGLYNHDYPAMPFMYNHVYARIRKCNLFLKLVEEHAGNFSEEWRKQREAEVRFLRVYFYHLLWMAYGGVPLVTDVLHQASQGDDIFKHRSTSEETYDFMVSELDAIANDLPTDNTAGAADEGRAGKGATLFLKGWIELFAGNHAQSATTYKRLIDEMGDGKPYGLFEDFHDQFLEGNNNNKETIFAYQHEPSARTGYRNNYYGPKGNFNGWASMQPTQNLVDDYAMDNGLRTSEAGSGYDESAPYDNREPRFYQSILFDGVEFAGQVYQMREGQQFARNPAAENNTGYFRRKGIDASLVGNLHKDGANYIYFRYAEALLNYAEASIEAGDVSQSVIEAIDKVRLRGGIPSLQQTYGRTLTRDELREIVRRERRVELAFENKRWWDLMRWHTAEEVLNQPIYGVDIRQQGGQWVYDTRAVVHTQQFFEHNYLFPIYQGWIDSNPKMKAQNGPEWVNGQNPGY